MDVQANAEQEDETAFLAPDHSEVSRYRSQYVTMTLGGGALGDVDGTSEQLERLEACIDEVLPQLLASNVDPPRVVGLLVSKELHLSGKFHYHALLKLSREIYGTGLRKLRGAMDKFLDTSTGNRVEFPKCRGGVSKNYQFWMAYMCKGGPDAVVLEKGVFEGVWQDYGTAYAQHADQKERSMAIVTVINRDLANVRAAAQTGRCVRRTDGENSSRITEVDRVANIKRLIRTTF